MTTRPAGTSPTATNFPPNIPGSGAAPTSSPWPNATTPGSKSRSAPNAAPTNAAGATAGNADSAEGTPPPKPTSGAPGGPSCPLSPTPNGGPRNASEPPPPPPPATPPTTNGHSSPAPTPHPRTSAPTPRPPPSTPTRPPGSVPHEPRRGGGAPLPHRPRLAATRRTAQPQRLRAVHPPPPRRHGCQETPPPAHTRQPHLPRQTPLPGRRTRSRQNRHLPMAAAAGHAPG